MDPRRANGGVFLGLNGTGVKSHGSADDTGVAAVIKLAPRLAASGFSDRLGLRFHGFGWVGLFADQAQVVGGFLAVLDRSDKLQRRLFVLLADQFQELTDLILQSRHIRLLLNHGEIGQQI